MSYVLHEADCRDAMLWMEDASVDAVVTDPPYELTSSRRTVPAPHVEGSPYSRHRMGVNGDTKPVGGFMGHAWDGSGIAYDVDMWREVLRVLKPGGHLLAFSGSRTYHRMVVAIEDAGFEIRDQIMWLYGSGFPKSLDVSKAIDKAAGATREQVAPRSVISHQRNIGNRCPYMDDPNHTTDSDIPATPEALRWQGWGTALKPAHEPIVVARKPLIGTVASNVLAHGTGALNIDGCRIAGEDVPEGRSRHGGGLMEGSSFQMPDSRSSMPAGRWPANVIHDGSDEVLAGFPKDAGRFYYAAKASKADRDSGLAGFEEKRTGGMQATADGSMLTGSGNERVTKRANTHPTVKPNDLMRYLCRLVTPPGGTVFDPFTGSGSTGKAAVAEGFDFIGCEMTPEYVPIARARIEAAMDPLS